MFLLKEFIERTQPAASRFLKTRLLSYVHMYLLHARN